jgi:hypothetical protein
MNDRQDPPPIAVNRRVGALALAIGAPLNLILHMQGPKLGPLSYAAWLALSFGLLCFCEEMGARKPLNRAGLVLFGAAFCAVTVALVSVDPAVVARASLLYAFATLGALVFWSVSLMHRARTARTIGAIGTAVGGGALVLLVAAHLLLGATTILGFSQLFVALETPGRATVTALAAIDTVLCVWALPTSILLWTARLRP